MGDYRQRPLRDDLPDDLQASFDAAMEERRMRTDRGHPDDVEAIQRGLADDSHPVIYVGVFICANGHVSGTQLAEGLPDLGIGKPCWSCGEPLQQYATNTGGPTPFWLQ